MNEENQNQSQNDDVATQDQGLGDWAAQTIRYTDEDREKLVQNTKLTRNKLVEMLLESNKQLQRSIDEKATIESERDSLEIERDSLDDRYTTASNEILRVNKKLTEEEDYSKTLEDRLDSLNANANDTRPVVMMISDQSGKQVYESIDSKDCAWSYMDAQNLADFEDFWNANKAAIMGADKLIIMLGRGDILADTQRWDLVNLMENVIKILKEVGIPYVISQILPIEKRSKKTDVNVLNRKIINPRSGYGGIDLTAPMNKDDTDIYKSDDSNKFEADFKKEVAAVIVKAIGVPDKHIKTPVADTDDNDSGDKYTEMIGVEPKYKGPLIGKKGSNIRDIEDQTSCAIKAIEYRYNEFDEVLKHGILITGMKGDILHAKVTIADKLAQIQDDDEARKSSSATQRGEKRKGVQGWPSTGKKPY